MSGDRTEENLVNLIDTKVHLNLEINKEEAFWEQRAHVNWLQLGDKNTAFFHRYASTHNQFYFIVKLECANGTLVYTDKDLKDLATRVFQNLFTSSGVGDFSHILSRIDASISSEINRALAAEFTKEEVYCVLKNMGPTKALGFDEFPTLFYQ